MTRQEAFERLELAETSLACVVEHLQNVLADGAELLEGDDAEWLYYALEHAEDARYAILNRGPYRRFGMEFEHELA